MKNGRNIETFKTLEVVREIDPEIEAIQSIFTILKPFNYEEKERMLDYIRDRFGL